MYNVPMEAMRDEEIDYQYLESLPTLLEIQGLAERTEEAKDFVYRHLPQPSFVSRVMFDKTSMKVFMPLGFVFSAEVYGEKLIVQGLTVCCLSEYDYSGYCYRCRATQEDKPFPRTTVWPQLSLVPEESWDVGESTGESAFTQVLGLTLSDKKVDTLNSILIAAELWHLIFAYDFFARNKTL